MPLTLHATWLRVDNSFPDGKLFFWAENLDASLGSENGAEGIKLEPDLESNGNGRTRGAKMPSHPFQASVGQVRVLLTELIPGVSTDSLTLESVSVWLPTIGDIPLARRSVLQKTTPALATSDSKAQREEDVPHLAAWQVTGVCIAPLDALTFLSYLDRAAAGKLLSRAASWRRLRLGNDLLFWSNAAKVVLEILVGQHYLPSMRSDENGRFFRVLAAGAHRYAHGKSCGPAHRVHAAGLWRL